jgi:DNA invertase Pin-like site-specific DNA recombinase
MQGNIAMKAVGYIRVSTPGQAKEGESLRTQREAIERYAQDRGWELIEVYADEGISGAKNNRPALNALLDDAKKKKFDFVIIHSLSRFGRNARELLNNNEILKNKEIKLHSIKDGIDYSTHYGQAMLTMLAAIAQLERDTIDEQMKENKMARWKEHRIIIGKLPFGYDWDKTTKKIIIKDKEAEVYKKMVSIYLNEGNSFVDIAAYLDKENIKPRRANKWASPVISYILKNPIYYGNYVVNRLMYDGKKRTKKEKPKSEHIVWELDEGLRLISKNKWDLIQKKTSFNKKKGKHIKISEDYFLRDVLVCGECGGVIKPRHGMEKKDKSRRRYYACYWRWTSEKELRDKGKKRCRLPFINADDLEEYVWYYLISYLTLQNLTLGNAKNNPYDELFSAKEYEYKIQRLSDNVIEFESEIKKNLRSKERLYSILEDEQYNKEEFLSRIADISNKMFTLTSRQQEIKHEIDNIEEMKQNDKLYKEFITNRKGFIQDLLSSLHHLSVYDKKLLVEGVLREKIRIFAGSGDEPWEPTWPKFRFNKDILVRLIDDGKINILDKDTRQAFGEHRFSASRRPNEEHRVAPRRRDLKGPARHRLTGHVQ